MHYLYLDTETYSKVDLTRAGAYRYAEDPSTEITVVQWAVDDGPVQVRDVTGRAECPELVRLIQQAIGEGWWIVIHNSTFDRLVLKHCWGLDIPVSALWDTMAQAQAHSLPGGLDKVCKILGVDSDLSKGDGYSLIQLFCKPHKGKRYSAWTHPREWDAFLDYARLDIVALREVHQRLPRWNYPNNPTERAVWELDQRINDRGVAIDTRLCEAAVVLCEERAAELREEVQDYTLGEVGSATQRAALLDHIARVYDVSLADLKSDTVRKALADAEIPPVVRALLEGRQEASKASTAKYKRALQMVCADGRVRGLLMCYGAQRTGRWSGKGLQPQNFSRPEFSVEEIEAFIRAAIDGDFDLLGVSPLLAMASAVRGIFISPDDVWLEAADLANIEGRGLVWLAGERWKLRAFADYDAGRGPDLYVRAYAAAFNIAPAAVGKAERQIGKVMELALGYQGGVGAFLTFAAVYRMDLTKLAMQVRAVVDDAEWATGVRAYEWAVDNGRDTYGLTEEVFAACAILRNRWRAAHPSVVEFWKACEQAFRLAIEAEEGAVFSAGAHIRVTRRNGWLLVRLPSGRFLCYLAPRIEEDGSITYAGVNQLTKRWSRIKTYGGKIVENITQAVARDILAEGMLDAESEGHAIVLSVHDEAISERADDIEPLAAILARPRAWALDIPLAAKGFTAQRYRKDD